MNHRNTGRKAPRTATRAGWPLATVLLATLPLAAQQPDAAAKQQMLQAKVAALKQSLAQNKAALSQYSWTETTEISLKGEVKKRLQKACRYGADGKVQKTPIGSDSPPPPPQESGGRRGRVKEKVVAKKVDEMKDYMERATALIHQYVPPDPEKIQAAAKSGNAAIQPGAAGIALAFKNYVLPNDQMTIGLDTAATKIQNVNIASYLDKPEDAVTLAVSFAGLPDGTNYPGQTVLDAKAKQITVRITNSGYSKAGQ